MNRGYIIWMGEFLSLLLMPWKQFLGESVVFNKRKENSLTLDVGNALIQDLLQHFGVLKLLLDLGDNAIGELSLLSLLHLTFIS